jgi:hypothetical protein
MKDRARGLLPIEETCAAYLANPDATCGEGPSIDLGEAKKTPKGWVGGPTLDLNCGWNVNESIATNNQGKYVCNGCTNAHNGYDIQESVKECTDICKNARFEMCAGFAHFLPGVLGGDCLDHGAEPLGSCYFRQSFWIEEGFQKPGVNCYKRKEKKSKKGSSGKDDKRKARRTTKIRARGEAKMKTGGPKRKPYKVRHRFRRNIPIL